SGRLRCERSGERDNRAAAAATVVAATQANEKAAAGNSLAPARRRDRRPRGRGPGAAQGRNKPGGPAPRRNRWAPVGAMKASAADGRDTETTRRHVPRDRPGLLRTRWPRR